MRINEKTRVLCIERGISLKISNIVEMKKDGTYKKYHVKHNSAKGFITSTEGFWDQTEYPIIAVEKRKVSSKRIPSLSLEDERMVEIACLIYPEKFDKCIVNETLTVKEIVDRLFAFDNTDLPICSYSNLLDNPEREWWYIDCINMYPSDNYDCRCKNISKFFRGYHKEGFLS